MSEFRRDPVIGRWIIISAARQGRPSDFSQAAEDTNREGCAFCEGHEATTPPEIVAFRAPGSVKNGPGWWVRVIPNKYPALSTENKLTRFANGMYDRMEGFGDHEVIIETPDHTQKIYEIEDKKFEDIVWMYRDRILELKADHRFEYVLIFKNHGQRAGATLAHPHSQLIAMPVVPKRVKEEIDGAKLYFDYKERCVFCDMIRQEQAEKERLVVENENFISYCPYASRFPFETSIVPKKHASHFEEISKEGLKDFAACLKQTLYKLSKSLENPSFNFIIHNSPLRKTGLEHYHWHLEIIPKLAHVAGFEWGSGFYLNSTPPETAAKAMNEIK